MNKSNTSNNVLKLVAVLAISGVIAAPAHASLMATATITATQLNATTYHYAVRLNDTGTTAVGTFWFSWIPGQDYMAVSPTNVLSPTLWSSMITNTGAGDGYAIQWVAGPGGAMVPVG